ncbi:hypothetical protein OTU49_009288 [Cherax quadricarinatus]|uniref:Pyridoxal-dependent decarboxylase domain-containing protein 1 n=1 Tax=Cherax quadricarinatus TaxID=27406 RepID=A0AAW0WBE5_CHEQU
MEAAKEDTKALKSVEAAVEARETTSEGETPTQGNMAGSEKSPDTKGTRMEETEIVNDRKQKTEDKVQKLHSKNGDIQQNEVQKEQVQESAKEQTVNEVKDMAQLEKSKEQEQQGVEEEEEEEEEEDDVFGALSVFTSEVFATLSSPAEPLQREERNPRPLAANGVDPANTMRLLQDLMTYDEEEPDVTYGLGPMDSHGRLAVVSHLLAALVTTLDPQHLRRLATRIMSDSCVWVSRLFRYFESTAYIHEDVREGVVRVCRMLLHTRYPKYTTDGYQALYARPPVIYTSSTVRPGLPQHIATMLGIGCGCVRVVPCNTIVGSPVAMDTAALDRMMAEDLAAQKKPFLVIANAGGGAVGGVDNVGRIQELCNNYEAWLHVEGHALAALTLPNAPNLTLGQSGVVSRFQHAFELGQHLQQHLATLSRIRLLSPAPPDGSNFVTIQDLVTKPISTSQLLETVSGSVVFQYVDEANNGGKNTEYYDNLNSWLGQVVRRDVGTIPLELVQLETAGLVLRWSPMEGPDTHHITLADVDHLIHSLHHQLDILNATVEQRKTFTELVSSANNLQLVEIPGWAGLGGVRYIADLWLDQNPVLETTKDDINALNVHLVSQLKATDSAFSLGEGSDGLNCVRFGMVTADTDLSELLSLVITTGREIETSSRFLDQMTDIVRKGIEAATEDLKRENEERLWQEGILRHVPIVGSVYNWFSPAPPPGIKGRTLDLTAGVLESTENIYRYHMQIRHGSAPTRSETKLPPAPSVQTPVSPSASSPSHSRSSSTTSALVPGSTHSRQASDLPPTTPDIKNISAPTLTANGTTAAV